ncbi:MAG: hypothetical protein AVDCRST_MAG52-2693, partial [uncultured Blastococcus sp.]
ARRRGPRAGRRGVPGLRRGGGGRVPALLGAGRRGGRRSSGPPLPGRVAAGPARAHPALRRPRVPGRGAAGRCRARRAGAERLRPSPGDDDRPHHPDQRGRPLRGPPPGPGPDRRSARADRGGHVRGAVPLPRPLQLQLRRSARRRPAAGTPVLHHVRAGARPRGSPGRRRPGRHRPRRARRRRGGRPRLAARAGLAGPGAGRTPAAARRGRRRRRRGPAGAPRRRPRRAAARRARPGAGRRHARGPAHGGAALRRCRPPGAVRRAGARPAGALGRPGGGGHGVGHGEVLPGRMGPVLRAVGRRAAGRAHRPARRMDRLAPAGV